jgi:hypothetical protein
MVWEYYFHGRCDILCGASIKNLSDDFAPCFDQSGPDFGWGLLFK